MRSPSVNWLLRLVLVPVWALLVGFTPGRWHCADGRPCAVATVTACCCDAEAEERSLPICDKAPAHVAVTAADCGCYRQAVQADTLASRVQLLDALAPSPVLPRAWELPAADGEIYYAVPSAAHGPPRYLTAPADPRGPPIA